MSTEHIYIYIYIIYKYYIYPKFVLGHDQSVTSRVNILLMRAKCFGPVRVKTKMLILRYLEII